MKYLKSISICIVIFLGFSYLCIRAGQNKTIVTVELTYIDGSVSFAKYKSSETDIYYGIKLETRLRSGCLPIVNECGIRSVKILKVENIK